jgi:hypothetical protein
VAAAVYVLCFLMSLACAILLLRGYAKSGARLLLWSGLCFIGLALNNGMLFLDRVILLDTDLYLLRALPALIGLLLLIYGLVWEAE